MTGLCIKLKDLWGKNSYLLESENANAPDFKFSSYHVITVKHFLNTLFSEQINVELGKLPDITLNGIINASHFVKLSRTYGIDSEKFNPSQLPVANNLLANKTRNVIDRSLLCLGLRRQCGFLLPDSYYGIDAIIPVCLDAIDKDKRSVYTFIGVQVKSAASVDYLNSM